MCHIKLNTNELWKDQKSFLISSGSVTKTAKSFDVSVTNTVKTVAAYLKWGGVNGEEEQWSQVKAH